MSRDIDAEQIVARIPMHRRILYAMVGIALSAVMLLFFAELVCRLLPVNQGLRTQPVNEANPVYRFEANRTSTWSRGWNFSITNKVHVNNAGFVNDQDYTRDGARPLLAVVGDSYIEAGMVPYRETVQGRLAEAMGSNGRAYSFAASGAGLTQYLVWAAHARDAYRPDSFLFLNIANDFAESLHHRGRSPGFHRFARLADGSAEIRRDDYEPTLFRRLARYSALAMYLVLNAKIEQQLSFNLKELGADNQRWASNIPYDGTAEEYSDYEWATRTFLDRLPEATGVAPGRIVIAIDGMREAIYNPAEQGALAKSVWGRMRTYMAAEARARGFIVIDMQPVFEAAFRSDRRRFEFPTDTHWNGHAHGLLAGAVIASGVLSPQITGLGGKPMAADVSIAANSAVTSAELPR